MQKEKNISNINNDSSEKRGTARIGNIVLITHWLDGDVIPFIRIGKELKKRGHEVTLITHCYFESMAKKAGLQFEAWDTKEEYEALVEDMSITQKRDSNNEGVLLLMDRYSEFHQKYEGKEIRLREYEKVKKYCQKENTVILCKNRSSIAAYMVAEELHLPLASVMMNPTEVISILSYEKLFEQKDVPELNDIRKSIGLKPIQTWLQWESSPKMTIALWPKWYDDNLEEWPSKIDMVGFPLENGKEAFNRQIPEEFDEWLKKHPRPVLITGGTTKLIDDKFYPVSIEACGKLGCPTIVVTRYRELLPETLPDNVVWYEYLPLDMILQQVGVLIHHGGMGTLSGAMKAAIPQLVLPYYVDRPYNANLVYQLGIGNYLSKVNWTPDKIADMILELRETYGADIYQHYRKKMIENHGVTAAADYVEKMIGNETYNYELRKPFNLEFENTITSKQTEKGKEVLSKLTESQKRQLLMRLAKVVSSKL